jgi:BNR repeat protein
VRAEHRQVYSDPYSYCAHPHAVTTADATILVVFNRAPRRRAILHPPQDPAFENLITRSHDGGRSWSAPVVVPDYGWSGTECAGLTVTRAGRVLLNQFRFRWYPLPLARRRAATEPVALPKELVANLLGSTELDSGSTYAVDPERLAPWGRGNGRTFVHLSDDGGETFARTVELDVAPYVGGYGMRSAAELADGTLVLPLSDAPHYQRVFVVKSQDGGLTWSAPIAAAEDSSCLFEEPAPLALPSGRLLMLLRENRRRTTFSVHSDDGGQSWSTPVPTGIDGYPPHLLAPGDGRLLCTYGYRKPPFAIRAVFSDDGGATWDTEQTVAVCENLPNKDLGYPSTVATAGGLLTLYYTQDTDGVTGIRASTWAL